MKREALAHSKMKKLCRRLDTPLYQGVGIMESIWHLTAAEAPQGDIGRLSNEDIALAIDYRGDEAELIEALVLAGWLDRHETHRLVVHDWSEHATDAVQMRMARNRLYFADGAAPKLTRLPGKEKEACAQFYGLCAQDGDSSARRANKSAQNGDSWPPPLPIPLPKPLNTPPSPSEEGAGEFAPSGSTQPSQADLLEQEIARAASAIHERHPRNRRDCGVAIIRKSLLQILKHRKVVGDDRVAYIQAIDANHAACCASHDWQKDGAQYAKGLSNWLAPTRERYDVQPAAGQEAPRMLLA